MNVEDFLNEKPKPTPEEKDHDFANLPALIVGGGIAVGGLMSEYEGPWIIWPLLGLGLFLLVRWFLRSEPRLLRIVRYGFHTAFIGAVVIGALWLIGRLSG